MDERSITLKLKEILASKNLTDFERVQLEDVLASLEERIENPVLAEDLPQDNRTKKYHAVYKRRVGIR